MAPELTEIHITPLAPFPERQVLGVPVHAPSYRSATEQICTWAESAESRYVVVSGVHGVMVAHDQPAFHALMHEADLVTPDGMPLVWALRLFGVPGATRVYGPDLMLHLLEAAAQRRIPVGFYGSSEKVLHLLVRNMEQKFPGLDVAYAFAPPFRALDDVEESRIQQEIVQSRAGILFVGLGCPKQEYWMAKHRGIIPAVMVGVGAAFDFHAGTLRQAPAWMQRSGLEWLFRLIMEPKRLWHRYLWNNPRFIALFIRQVLHRSR